VDSCFGNNVGVKLVAKIDRVDVVAGMLVSFYHKSDESSGCGAFRCLITNATTQEALGTAVENSPFQIAIHDGEKHLQKQVDGINQHRQ
jgi:hypothetical protein